MSKTLFILNTLERGTPITKVAARRSNLAQVDRLHLRPIPQRNLRLRVDELRPRKNHWPHEETWRCGFASRLQNVSTTREESRGLGWTGVNETEARNWL